MFAGYKFAVRFVTSSPIVTVLLFNITAQTLDKRTLDRIFEFVNSGVAHDSLYIVPQCKQAKYHTIRKMHAGDVIECMGKAYVRTDEGRWFTTDYRRDHCYEGQVVKAVRKYERYELVAAQ